MLVHKGVNETIVTWDNVTARDWFHNLLSPHSDIVSGSIFGLGKTRVTYDVEDEAGNVNECSFYVIVRDRRKCI